MAGIPAIGVLYVHLRREPAVPAAKIEA